MNGSIAAVPTLDLDLVVHALFLEAVTRAELNEWAVLALGGHPEYPACVVDLIDFRGQPGDLLPLLGRAPAPLAPGEDGALTGIAHARGLATECAQLGRAAALRALRNSPALVERFQKAFPFIDLPALAD